MLGDVGSCWAWKGVAVARSMMLKLQHCTRGSRSSSGFVAREILDMKARILKKIWLVTKSMYKISARCNLMLSVRPKLWCKQGGAVWQVNLFRVDLQVSHPMQVGWHRWAQFGTKKWWQTGIETTAKPMRTKTQNRKSSENHMTFWYIIWQFMHCSCYFASIFLQFLMS